jgi:SAM-dependent methyltransferase
MGAPDRDKVFAGSIPKLYEALLVPMIFAPYAKDVAGRVAARLAHRPQGARLLEIAAGTGVVTRALAATLPATVDIVATDLNAPMLDLAASLPTARPVTWRLADAMQLPFEDASFDVVVCQFGAMFFPDRASAYAEARRVLRPDGLFLFSAWDRIEDNEFADVVTDALARLFPGDPPRFLARTPHGYHDTRTIAGDVARGGFDKAARIATIAARSPAASPREPALAYCHGTPLRNEIEARDAARLDEATRVAEAALARRFGTGAIDGRIQAHVVAVER